MSTLSEHWIQDYYDLRDALIDAELISSSQAVATNNPTISGSASGYIKQNIVGTITNYDPTCVYALSVGNVDGFSGGMLSQSDDSISWILSESSGNYTASIRAAKSGSLASEVVSWNMSVTDPYDKLLLHMDGANNGTVFVDSSPHNHTITRYNAITTTDDKKIGTASAYFNGTNAYLDITGSSIFQLGTGDFTIEFWMKTSTNSIDTYYRRIFMLDGPTGNTTNNVQVTITPTSGFINVWSTTGGLDFYGITNVSNNIFHHIAVVRESGVVKLYVDGYLHGYQTWAVDVNITNPRPRIGAYTSTQGRYVGLIDELRVSTIARYTSNFTPFTIPYKA